MKRIVVAIFLCFFVFWLGRIYSINRIAPDITCYDVGESVVFGDLRLDFDESHLYTPDEFKTRFGLTPDGEYDEYRIISLCIEVTNLSDRSIEWSEVFAVLDLGFESSVWASSTDPMLLSRVNRFNHDNLPSKESQKIWFMTEVNSICFKDSSWENIDDYQYWYVISLVPQKTAVRLVV